MRELVLSADYELIHRARLSLLTDVEYALYPWYPGYPNTSSFLISPSSAVCFLSGFVQSSFP